MKKNAEKELDAKLEEESKILLNHLLSSKRVLYCLLVSTRVQESKTTINKVTRRYKILCPAWDVETGLIEIIDISKDISRVTGLKFIEGKDGRSGVQVNNQYYSDIMTLLAEKMHKIPLKYEGREY